MTLLTAWPWFGALAALVMIFWVASGDRRRASDPWWWLVLLLPVYVLHQFEEHGIDARGHVYAFRAALCHTLHQPQATCPADEAFIFAVNVGGVWLAGALAAFASSRRDAAGIAILGLPFVNGVVHIAAAVRERAYNPGLLTAIALLVPYALVTARLFLRARVVLARRALPVIMVAGVLLHGVLLAALMLYSRGSLSRPAMLAIQVANGALPFVLGRIFLRAAPPAQR
jgi:hypothetical protein